MFLFFGVEGVSVGEIYEFLCLFDKIVLNVVCNWIKFVLEIVFIFILLVIVEIFIKK